MKKTLLITTFVILLCLLCACGSQQQSAQPSPTPAAVSAVPVAQVSDGSAMYQGKWYVDPEKTGVAKLSFFGSSYHDYGSELNIDNGNLSFHIGITGGKGTYTFASNVFTAQLIDDNEKTNRTETFTVFNENSSVYLTQPFSDGTNIIMVYWTKTPPAAATLNPNATPTPEIVYVVGDPKETASPTATPQIVNVVDEPKKSAAPTVNVHCKTLSPYESAYSSTISSYAKAITNKYSVEDCYNNNINYLVGYLNSNNDGGKLGYCYADVDGNGVDELIIGIDKQIYAMYTLVNNQPVQVIDAGERNAYYLEPDGVIVNVGSSSAFLSAYTFYHLEGSKLVVNNALVSDFSANEAEPWFYAEDDDWDVKNDSHISTEKAMKWIKAYEDNYITFPFVPIV